MAPATGMGHWPSSTKRKVRAMPEQGVNPEDYPDEPPKLDENKAGEVPTSFATKGLGWSGREEQEEESAPEADRHRPSAWSSVKPDPDA